MNLPVEFHSLNQNYKVKDYLTIEIQVEKTWERTINDHAIARSNSNKNHHTEESEWTSEYEIIGVLGELAFQILTGLPMDMTIGTHNPWDFKTRDIEIDIKSTKNQEHLSIKQKRFFDNAKYYYVLCKVDLVTYKTEFLGWIEGNKVKLRCDSNWSYEGYGVHKSKLNSMKSLERILRSKNILNGTGEWK